MKSLVARWSGHPQVDMSATIPRVPRGAERSRDFGRGLFTLLGFLIILGGDYSLGRREREREREREWRKKPWDCHIDGPLSRRTRGDIEIHFSSSLGVDDRCPRGNVAKERKKNNTKTTTTTRTIRNCHDVCACGRVSASHSTPIGSQGWDHQSRRELPT
jgi:hypothetical protein